MCEITIRISYSFPSNTKIQPQHFLLALSVGKQGSSRFAPLAWPAVMLAGISEHPMDVHVRSIASTSCGRIRYPDYYPVGGEKLDLVVLSLDKANRAKLLSERFTIGSVSLREVGDPVKLMVRPPKIIG
jgi:hypothetical protein